VCFLIDMYQSGYGLCYLFCLTGRLQLHVLTYQLAVGMWKTHATLIPSDWPYPACLADVTLGQVVKNSDGDFACPDWKDFSRWYPGDLLPFRVITAVSGWPVATNLGEYSPWVGEPVYTQIRWIPPWRVNPLSMPGPGQPVCATFAVEF